MKVLMRIWMIHLGIYFPPRTGNGYIIISIFHPAYNKNRIQRIVQFLEKEKLTFF